MGKRRILIVTHHFPPSTVAATFRPLRLAKYLPRMGYRVWVLCTASGVYSDAGRTDDELVKEIPPQVRVTRVPNMNPVLWHQSRDICSDLRPRVPSGSSSEQIGFHRAVRRVKSLIVEMGKFPDIDASWAAASLLPALYLIIRNRIDVIYTNGPPFGAHLLGLVLKRLTRRVWIVQYGNPWTANPSIEWTSDFFRRQCECLDREIVRLADAVLVLDDTLATCIAELGRNDGVHIHPNGYDPDHFEPTDPPAGKFTITYAGSLYNVHNPTIVYDALSLIEQRDPAARADMRVVFAGPPESDPMRSGAPADLEFTGPLRHSEVVGRLNDSHLLLDFLTGSSNGKLTVSCKLYEYMAARRPVLAVTPEGPMAREVRRLNLGKVVPCDDPSAVADAILECYNEYRAGKLCLPYDPAIEAYSAPSLVREFAEFVDGLCAAAEQRRMCAPGRAR